MTKKVGVDVLAGDVVRVREMSQVKANSELVGVERAGAVARVRLRVPAWYSLHLLYWYKRAPAAALRTSALRLR